jgi:hypothetical protein
MLRLVLQNTPIIVIWAFLWFWRNADNETRQSVLAAIGLQ